MRLFRLLSFVLVVVLLLSTSSAQLAIAQGIQPIKPPAPFSPDPQPPSGPRKGQDGIWYIPADNPALPGPINQAEVAGTGGPDEYGYTWSDVSLAWIDASGGTNRTTAAINLGFDFKYYENTYSQIYVSQFGFASFSNVDLYWSQSTIPNPSSPNNVIAPNWAPVNVVNGYIRYLTGGSAPNRFFVVEWNRLDAYNGNEYTFEMILYESGDIVFQYQTMTYGISGNICQSSGIEDSQGLNGLTITPWCSPITSDHAVRVYRPAPTVRIQISPRYQGNFTKPGGVITAQISVRNTGDFGADTYDLLPSMAAGWALTLYASDGSTPLTDTDGDGTIDTGSVGQGSVTQIVARLQAPGGAQVGDSSTATVTVRSSLNTSISKTLTLQTAIPASFAQAYQDSSDGAMSLYLVHPGGQAVKKATSPYYGGGDIAISETPNGNFAYTWTTGRCVTVSCTISIYEIEYTLLNKYGETVRAITKLTDNSSATVSTYDSSPVVAASPDGRIGILWYRYLYQNSQYNYNVFFAILDAAGNVTYGPVNLTNNSVWGSWGGLNWPIFSSPRIAATGDNRFVLAWTREHQEFAGSVDDIYYTVRNDNGNEVKNVTRLTSDTPGSFANYYPALTALQANRVFLSWISKSISANDGDIFYVVLASDGSQLKTVTNLSGDGSVIDWWNWDAVQLSDGNILAVWEAWGCFPGEWAARLRYAVLDTSYNRIGTAKCLGLSAVSTTGSTSASVTADAYGHGIITWTERDYIGRSNLYYALVNGSGSILTPPMALGTSMGKTATGSAGYGNSNGYGLYGYGESASAILDGNINTSYNGYGNTSYRSSTQIFLPLTRK